MRIALHLWLVGCVACGPPASPAPDLEANDLEAPDLEATEAPERPSADRAESSPAFALDPRPRPVLAGRLMASLPSDGSPREDEEPVPSVVMSARPWTYAAPSGGAPLRFAADELLATSGSELVAELERELVLESSAPAVEWTLDDLGARGGVHAVLAVPDRPPMRGTVDAFAHQAVLFVALPDRSIVRLSIGTSVDGAPPPSRPEPRVVSLARAIGATLRSGPTALLTSEGVRWIPLTDRDALEAWAPDGFVAAVEERADGAHARVVRVRELGRSSSEALELDVHPCDAGRAEPNGTSSGLADRVLDRDVAWRRAAAAGPRPHALAALLRDLHGGCVSIELSASDEEGLARLREIARRLSWQSD